MHIKELTFAQFDNFAKNFELSSYQQSTNYAIFMAENGFEYDLIGYVDELGVIKAAALILIKKINLTMKYGYSPKGFLIDYFDYDLLAKFTEDLKDYYAKKLVFIKINPELAIGEIDTKTKNVNYNQNLVIRDYLKELGYLKLKDNLYFEALYPRFNGIVDLRKYNFNNLAKNTKNKIKKAEKKGLILEKGSLEQLDILYNFVKKKRHIDPYYYKKYYNVFNNSKACDLWLIKIDFEKYLMNSKALYEAELNVNNSLNQKLGNADDSVIKQKMESDKKLLPYKNDIALATYYLNTKNKYIAGALVIKYKDRINIIISGIDEEFKKFNANYFLHYQILEQYKNEYNFVDLNGMTGNFSNDNPYEGLNKFKLGFKPKVYEFIGEFDLLINKNAYNSLLRKGLLAKEFNKK